MSDYQTIEIKNQFKVELSSRQRKIRLSDEKVALIEKIWQQELKLKAALYNGQMLSALSYDSKNLIGTFLPYKLFLAQLRKPALKSVLKIAPVSISGLTLLGENVVIGKRAHFVTQFPNCYELAPSGGIEKEFVVDHEVDLAGQIKKELFEEIGVDAKKVKTIRFFALVHDKKTDVIDLCALIKIQPFVIQSRLEEYSQIMTIPKKELPQFVKQYKEDFVPLSILILQLKRFI